MFVIHTSIPLDPDRREEATSLIADLVEYSRLEDGTVRYRAMKDLTEANVIRFFEQYEDESAVEEHVQSEPYRRFVEALPDLASGQLETIQFETNELDVIEFDPAEAIE